MRLVKKSHEDGQPIIKVNVVAVHDDGCVHGMKHTVVEHTVVDGNRPRGWTPPMVPRNRQLREDLSES